MRKTIQIDVIDVPIVLARRKGTRSIKLAISSHGSVRLTVPYGIPEFTAIAFARRKADWIAQHVKTPTFLQTGNHIGKSHTLYISHADISRPSTKISDVEIRIRLPAGVEVESSDAQATIRRASEKALLAQAETLLPQRVATLSRQYNLTYRSLSTKKLKSRWGACDSHNNLSFNTYLMQLPWPLIDYVIYHELAHTVHHNHSAEFWGLVESMLPHYKDLRKELKTKPTDVITT